jgi:hypothetical protein
LKEVIRPPIQHIPPIHPFRNAPIHPSVFDRGQMFIGSTIITGQTEGLKGGWDVWDGWAFYLLQYIYVPCTKFTSKMKRNYDGFKIAGIFFVFIFFLISLHGENFMNAPSTSTYTGAVGPTNRTLSCIFVSMYVCMCVCVCVCVCVCDINN